MPAPRLNDLRARKELILAEADLHRQLLALERMRWQRRGAEAQQFFDEKRWWVLGGSVVAGLLIARHGRAMTMWLPTVLATVRALMR